MPTPRERARLTRHRLPPAAQGGGPPPFHSAPPSQEDPARAAREAASIESSKAYDDMKACFSELMESEDKAAVTKAYYQARAVAVSTPKAAPGASKTLLHAFTRLLIGLMGQDRCAPAAAALGRAPRPPRPLTQPRAAPPPVTLAGR